MILPFFLGLHCYCFSIFDEALWCRLSAASSRHPLRGSQIQAPMITLDSAAANGVHRRGEGEAVSLLLLYSLFVIFI